MNKLNVTDNIAQAPPTVKPVAIYCRVSSENQEAEGTSLSTQREACLKYSQGRGYQVIHQFIETWSGLSLERPKLDELRGLIRAEQISGIVIYCLDRLSRDPTHGVILQEELERHHVTLEAVTETVESTDLGKLISYIRGYAAKLEAEKIRERTMRGTRARVLDKKLPVTFRQPFGYSWDRENKRLVPNQDHAVVKEIFTMALNGKTYDGIIADLKKRHILTPTGLPEWNKHTLSSILHNPLYTGKFYTLKSEVVKPKKRNGNTAGNSSIRRLPIEQWHYLPEVQVVNPPITLEQRALILDQLAKRQALSQRNAKRNYLLRGMVVCETHKGKHGKLRVFHGQPYHDLWRYTCPVGKCDSQFLDGPRLELKVLQFLASVVWSPEITPDSWVQKYFSNKNQRETRQSLETELDNLGKRELINVNKTVRLEDRYLSREISESIYPKLKQQYQDERIAIKKQQDALLSQLANLNRTEEAIRTIEELRLETGAKLFNAFARMKKTDPKNWPAENIADFRRIFDLLKLQVHVYPNKIKGLRRFPLGLGGKPVKLAIWVGIALPSPGAGEHNQQYYPLRFALSDITTPALAGARGGG